MAVDGVGRAAARADHQRVVLDHVHRGTEFQRLHVERRTGPQQTEPRLVIIGDHMGFDRGTMIAADDHRLRLGNQIADGHRQPVFADQHRVAFALRAEIGRRKGVFRGP